MGWRTERPDPHPDKAGEGWLINTQLQKVVCFRNALPTAHAKWVEVETRTLSGVGQPIIRRMLRQNAIAAWTQMLKTGWIRSEPIWTTKRSDNGVGWPPSSRPH